MRRYRRLLRALAAALACASAEWSARAEDTPCPGACPPPMLAPPERALRRAVHLTWTDPHAAIAKSYEIERRRGGESDGWIAVAKTPANRPPHHDDAGPGGEGLVPGEYQYRLRGLHRAGLRETWSEWSPTRGVSVLDACAEAGGEIAGLPRIIADDHDGDGRYTGADLVRALRDCAKLGGCVIEALPVTYDDVAILISYGDPHACGAQRTACLTDRFPKGLAIEGHGSSTVLRSPLWPSPYIPEPILEVWRRPDLRIQLRHLVLDGRKTEQRDPLPGQNNANGWRHFGFHSWNQWFQQDPPNRGGCLHDLVVRDFMSIGISLADVARWSVEYNSIEGIGCHRELTPCPLLTVPDAFGPGYTSTGMGVYIDWYSEDVVVRANRIRRATKYSIGLKHAQDGAEPSIRRPLILDNDIDEAGAIGIFVGGVAEGLFQGNRIAATDSLNPQPEARAWNDTFGISCFGAAERTGFRRNRIENMAGMAIQWNCIGPGNYIAETRIAGSCRRKGPRSCTPGKARECYLQPDIWVIDGAAGSLALVDNEVAASGCSAPLGVDLYHPDIEVLIRGGHYSAGREAMQPVRFLAVDVLLDRGASFSGTSLAFGPGSRGIVAPSVSVTGKDVPYRVDKQARVLVCPEWKRECEKICSDAQPPAWCAAPSAPARAP